MKLAHLADLHLGFRQFHRQTAGGLNQREADVANAFRRAIGQVIAERPDVVIVAGDLFHSVRPTNHSILLAFNEFHRLKEALPDVPLILVAGNHDTPRSTETGSIFGLFASLGADVVADAPRRLAYPALGLSVLAVPDAAWRGGEVPSLVRSGPEPCQVLVLHGEVEGLFPADRSAVEYGGALFSPAELARGSWNYVALGHYHVQREVSPRVWYSGSLEYVSTNPWGELEEERKAGGAGKGWLMVDLPAGTVARRPIPLARKFVDLPSIDGADLPAADLDGAIAAALAAVQGGHADQVIRQVVRNVPRHVAREMDHALIRRYKAEALHYLLDLRRPASQRETGVGSPGRRQTLPELVEEYLGRRLLSSEIDREAFVRVGVDLIQTVERERLEG